jgi:hypothetical protein
MQFTIDFLSVRKDRPILAGCNQGLILLLLFHYLLLSGMGLTSQWKSSKTSALASFSVGGPWKITVTQAKHQIQNSRIVVVSQSSCRDQPQQIQAG